MGDCHHYFQPPTWRKPIGSSRLIADKLYQIVYIRREGATRVISLRLASRKERGRYVHERARDTHSDR